MPVRLLVLSVYPEDQAGTRLRGQQFAPPLLAAGITTEFWSFLSLRDSVRWFSGMSAPSRALVLLRSALRLVGLVRCVRRADVVVVLREVLPIASPLVEVLVSRRAPVVWDVDDAVWTEYPRMFSTWLPQRLRRSPEKYERLARLSSEVWCGSEVLAQWCRRHAEHVHVVPTVLDVEALPTSTGDRARVVWIGSSSTAPFLRRVLPALEPLAARITVDVVGAGDRFGANWVREAAWSPETEAAALSVARVGLYPVDVDHPLGPGKAGLKAVLYMAHGVPCVVTPTETIAGLVRDGIEGFHARTHDEWRTSVAQLLDDDELWVRMAAAGRRRAEDYSLQRWAPWVAGRVRALAGSA